ncbi:Lysophospholipase L1 [Cnuella takakiae]|uniref:Lysophospholipase L1 n=1 Tax=Cnuella takakiae TaxID=1302690 RepID=A0A1M5EP23_9BACT|nr:SGNH/GDSL hydrolase family protein [Cnuella takakiae]OLY91251.1 GDSL family lipase [Cnuella takakiae]SHF81038.1 Lysophospholipase L1 [Cnuella takakiae]
MKTILSFLRIALLSFILLLAAFSQREHTWVAIGDSITYLNDHPSETGNRITKGYMTLVQQQVPGLHVINQGHNGWTAGRIADSIHNLGLVKADLYTIFLGTNDWWRGRPLGSFADYKNNSGNATVNGSFRIIINKLKALNPDAQIILITPMPRVDFVYINNPKNNAWGSYRDKEGQHLEQFANAIKAIGRAEGIRVVDLYHEKKLAHKNLVRFKRLKDPQTAGAYRNYSYPDFIGVPFNPDTDEYPYPLDAVAMTYDGLHPSDKGYEVIAGKLLPLIRKSIQ